MSNSPNSNSLSTHLNSPTAPSQTTDTEYPPLENLSIEDAGDSFAAKNPYNNKGKEVVIDNPSPTKMKNKITINVPPRVDVIEWLAGYAQSIGVSVSVLSGCGPISQVTLKHSGSQLPPQSYVEELNLVCFSGTLVLGPSAERSITRCFFNGALARKNGGFLGGSIFEMIASAPLELSVFIFNDPNFCKVGI